MARRRDGFPDPVPVHRVGGMPPGQVQRRKRPQVTFRRVRMGDDARMLYWDESGNLYSDEGLTDPTGLTIVRLGAVGDE